MASSFRAPNTPVYRASTVLFDSIAHLEEVHRANRAGDPDPKMYGTFGTPTTDALRDAVLAAEGGAGVVFAPSGLGAVAVALLTVARTGAHLLVPDSVYGPTRELCDKTLSRLGVETEYYDPMVGAEIVQLLRASTCAVLQESPGSYTFEVQDVPAISRAIRSSGHPAAILMDNAWGSPGLFRPLDHGVDISIIPLTKYWGGHADLLLGAVVASATSWSALRDTAVALGSCTNGDEAYLATRGARSVEIRLRQHERSGLAVAKWLQGQRRVGQVLHVAFPDCPGHDVWRRDYNGSNGLFAFMLLTPAGTAATKDEVAVFVDRLVQTGAFGLGYSWGGFESLVMPAVLPGGANITRTVSTASLENLVRLHIGLEPVERLVAALEFALGSALIP
ncbi:MAG: cystathionine beta-lyase [Gemmatimonadetes bacterium]|nr:cystathionine beta-lyase [Gemmatimonadota bacterium]